MVLNNIKGLYNKYCEVINYLIVGILTTLISLGTKYALLFTILDAKNSVHLLISVIISWIVSVLFAYITNRKFVFKSKDENIIKEMGMFFSARVATLIMEYAILWFFIDFLKMNSNFKVMVVTILSQVLILIGNYIFSKFWVFKNDKVNIKTKLCNKDMIFNIILFCICTIICYFFPYTHDDWAWGTSIGIDRLNTLFYDYNGRWCGNLLVLLLTRSRLLRALVISITLTLIIYMMKKNISDKKNWNKYVLIIFMCLMPVNIIAQSIAWTAGFANYAVSVLIVLIIMYANRNIFKGKDVQIKNRYIVPFGVLGFICSLFVEHMTIYNVLLSIFLVLYNIFKNKKIVWSNISYLIGTISGTILMFSNKAYHSIVAAEDTYRTVEQNNILLKSLKTYFENFYKLFIQNNIVLNISICLICIIFVYKYLKNNRKRIRKKKKIVIYSSSFILILFLIYNLFITVVGNKLLFTETLFNQYFEGLLNLFYFLSILSTVYICVDDKNRKFRLIFELISIILATAPLLIVTPIGPRCFLPIYIFFVLFAVDLLDYISDNIKIQIIPILKCICLILILFFFSIYGQVYIVDRERINYIKQHKKQEELVLPNLPYEEYMQSPNPDLDVFVERFKLFYKIKNETKIYFLPYNEWKEQYK